MIKYRLICDSGHEFDGWFPNSKQFTKQKNNGQLTCPMCESPHVDKAIMAPNIKRSKSKSNANKINKFKKEIVGDSMMLASQAKFVMRKIKQHIEKNFENVGDKFFEEAKKVVDGKRDDDKIYGTPSKEEVNKLLEEGIDLFHVPEIKDN